jgi:lipid A 3-O-deacylase
MTMKFAAGLLALMTCVSSGTVNADPSADHGTLSFLFENDLFYKTDRDYTNGVELSYTTAAEDTPKLFVDVARWLPFFSPSGKVRASYALGQSIYTPSHLGVIDPPLTDRPYAGFLYGGFGLSDDTGERLDQVELQIGVIGPSSLASDTQKFVHKIFNDRPPLGWQTQLRGEPGIVLTYSRNVKLVPRQSFLGLFIDLEPHYGGAVGNVYDYVNIGAMARIGFNIPDDYGPLRIEPSLPGSGYFHSTGDIGAYVFAGVDGRAIARNLFLDGNTWEPSRHVDKSILVGDLELGAAVTFNFMQVSFTHVIRTKEYKSQTAADQFGAVNLSFRL